MRVVFIGASDACIQAAKSLKKKGYEVVIIEKEKSLIDEISDQIDCSFLCGDGSKPDILREVSPTETDFLFCFSDNDQVNIIASLVGRSIGFKRVITRIEDVQFENVCLELGLNEIMIPSRTVARDIEDVVHGLAYAELSMPIKNEARLFLFAFEEKNETAIKDISLPSDTKIICYYRKGEFSLVKNDEELLEPDDEVVLLTHSKNLAQLREQFNHQPQLREHSNEE